MQNRFVKAIQDNVAYDEGFHTATPLSRSDSIVGKILNRLDVKKFVKFNQLDLNNIQKHVYRGARYYAVLIPVLKRNIETYVTVLVQNSDEDDMKTKIFTMDYSSNLELRYEDLNGNLEVTGTFNGDYELVQYKRETSGDVTTLDLADCLQKEWANLPWYIQAACGGSCASCFGLIVPACVVCAGCLVGFGINC
ncbi:hypothetical protein ACFVQB_09605 [Paenibacillus sp. NPDC057886]|uniref:hypothetical protein n=1 Tax=Paenibacillus sp. NPDC057886 TaxID=3346270 RepID=UPI0036C93BBA